jgi:hypothetical protein
MMVFLVVDPSTGDLTLLLAVELLAHGARSRELTETAPAALETARPVPSDVRNGETGNETGQVVTLAQSSTITQPPAGSAAAPTAQDVVWAHCLREQARGRIPTGAELDRVAGTNNYGRTMLRQWREQGRIPSPGQRNGQSLVGSGQEGRDFRRLARPVRRSVAEPVHGQGRCATDCDRRGIRPGLSRRPIRLDTRTTRLRVVQPADRQPLRRAVPAT